MQTQDIQSSTKSAKLIKSSISSNTHSKINIALFGKKNTGKTCYLKKCLGLNFQNGYSQTNGMVIYKKITNYRNKEFQINIWDFSGGNKPKSISSEIFRRIDGIIFCFALNDIESFTVVKQYIDRALREKINMANCILLGLKSDLDDNSIEKTDLRRAYMDYDLSYFDVSSKNDLNVDNSFEKLSQKIMNKRFPEETFNSYVLDSNETNSYSCFIF